MLVFGGDVHGLGQLKKSVKPTQKNLKKWVGLGDWVDMVLPNKPTYPIMFIFLFLFSFSFS